jgi:hypothetical protein
MAAYPQTLKYTDSAPARDVHQTPHPQLWGIVLAVGVQAACAAGASGGLE